MPKTESESVAILELETFSTAILIQGQVSWHEISPSISFEM